MEKKGTESSRRGERESGAFHGRWTLRRFAESLSSPGAPVTVLWYSRICPTYLMFCKEQAKPGGIAVLPSYEVEFFYFLK